MEPCLVLVGFHHERGNEIEWSYPYFPFKDDKDKLTIFEFLAMPDQVHNNERDHCYFVLGDYFCVSCYQQIAATKVKEKPKDVTRATIQKSFCLFTKNFNHTPLGLSFVRAKMQECFQSYFDQAQHHSFSDHSLLESFYQQIPSLILKAGNRAEKIEEHANLRSSPVLKLFTRFGRNALILFKLLLLEKKVVIYGMPIGETCDVIVALSSLLPLFHEKHSQIDFIHEGFVIEKNTTNNNQSIDNQSHNHSHSHKSYDTIQYSPEEKDYANLQIPLRISANCFISPSVALHQADWLSTLPSFFIGTSNYLFTQNRQVVELDVSFDANRNAITVHNHNLNNVLQLSPEDKYFIDHIIQRTNSPDEPFEVTPQQEKLVFDPFRDFLTSPAGSTDQQQQQQQIANSTSSVQRVDWQSKEEWARTMFAQYIKALLANVVLSQSGTAKADAWSGHWLAEWMNTNNYKTWLAHIDIRLIRSDITYTNMHHPGSDVVHEPSTLVGKGLKSVKGSIQSLGSGASNLVSTIGNVWQLRTQQSQDTEWGLEGNSASSSSSATVVSPPLATPPRSQNTDAMQINSPRPPSNMATVRPVNSSPSENAQQSKLSSFFDAVKAKVNFNRPNPAAHFETIGVSPQTVSQPAQMVQPSAPQPTTTQPSVVPEPIADDGEEQLMF